MTDRTHRRARRRSASVVALCAISLVVAACGSDSDSASDVTAAPAATSAPAATTSETAAAPADAFPVSIENKFGTTVIPAKPERVVSIGYTEGDFVLALGVTPVGLRDWYGEQPGGLWPWAAKTPAASDSTTVLQADTLNFEQIAELEPDVIVAMVSEIEQADYDTLTKIAPVVAQTDKYVTFGTPWDEVQLTIGKALGMSTEAQAVVDDVKGKIAAVAAAHPDWAGKSTNVVIPAADGSWYAYNDQDSRGRLMTELGFTIPKTIIDLSGDLFYAQGSGEQLSQVDADLLLYNTFAATDRPAVDALPLWKAIPAVAAGHSVYLDNQVIGAMSFGTSLSIPYALDGLVPQIDAALAA